MSRTLQMLRLILSYFLSLLFLLGMASTGHASILLSNEEAASLEIFFRHVLKEHEVGYVIEGVKPLCILGIAEQGDVYAGFPGHKTSLILKKGLRVWNAKLSQYNISSPIRIKAYDHPDSKASTYKHLLFIHKKLFLNTVDQNLSLFRYVLGPHLTSHSFYDTLINSSKDFSETFGGHDNVLVGIALGYGTENSLIVSRQEALQHNSKNLNPSIGFKSLEEEENYLSELVTLPVDELTRVKPCFIYGRRKNDPTSDAFDKKLIEAQKIIQRKLDHPDFLKNITFLLTGQDLVIQSNPITLTSSPHDAIENIVAKNLLISLYFHGFSSEDALNLIKALGNPGKETKEPFFQIKAHDLSNFYMRSSTFDLSKLIIAMERFRENPLELSPSEEAYLDDFYLNLYSAIPGTDKS
ncbi:hypothetical protein [Waddlia chondrophila]|nr:hypothetical protein [Waddlia chondrophila]